MSEELKEWAYMWGAKVLFDDNIKMIVDDLSHNSLSFC